MKSPLRTITVFLLITILVAGCNMPGTGGNTPNPNPTLTLAPVTEQVHPTNTQPVIQPTNKPTQVPPTPTTAVLPTATSTPIPTATATNAPTPTSASCSNQFKFVEDVTIPDNTEILPGQEFIKTWRLQNTGTCAWTEKYALIFVSGDQMNGNSPLPLTGSTVPGSTVDVSVTLKAPGTTGTYQGNWELRDPNGIIFASGTSSPEPFFVLIKVVEGVSDLNLGTATWTDNLDNANNWYLLDTANTKFTQADGKLVMTSINPGSGEEWGLSNKPSMNDYYLQATFITGSACSGLDRYGLLARSPDPDKGYVFEFSCDGHYRLYTWDGTNYHALQEWHTAAPIKTGSDQTNLMGIWMKGSTLRLYANGYKLAEFTDSTFDHGQFGLVIGSINTHNLTVYVDQVAYWEFNQ
jgi:hypothetical protein